MVVREDHMTLYGFADANEKDMFLLLQTISGVGPRMALNLISVMGEQKLSNAIANSDIGSLTAVPGIGKKGAQRLILELSDKIASPKNSAITSWRESLITALVGLGWNRKDASSAAEQVQTPENEADLSDSLRAALKILSKTR